MNSAGQYFFRQSLKVAKDIQSGPTKKTEKEFDQGNLIGKAMGGFLPLRRMNTYNTREVPRFEEIIRHTPTIDAHDYNAKRMSRAGDIVLVSSGMGSGKDEKSIISTLSRLAGGSNFNHAMLVNEGKKTLHGGHYLDDSFRGATDTLGKAISPFQEGNSIGHTLRNYISRYKAYDESSKQNIVSSKTHKVNNDYLKSVSDVANVENSGLLVMRPRNLEGKREALSQANRDTLNPYSTQRGASAFFKGLLFNNNAKKQKVCPSNSTHCSILPNDFLARTGNKSFSHGHVTPSDFMNNDDLVPKHLVIANGANPGKIRAQMLRKLHAVRNIRNIVGLGTTLGTSYLGGKVEEKLKSFFRKKE